jgi:hypothetical protein
VLTGPAELVSNHAPQHGIQGFQLLAREGSEGLIDERLVVPAPGVVNLLSKPIQNVVVEPNRDSGFLGWHPQNRSAPALAEVIFLLYDPPGTAGAPEESRAVLKSVASVLFATCIRLLKCGPGNPCRS